MDCYKHLQCCCRVKLRHRKKNSHRHDVSLSATATAAVAMTTTFKSSATAELARDADVGAHSRSLSCNVSAVYNLRPVNASTHYLQYLCIIISVYAFV